MFQPIDLRVKPGSPLADTLLEHRLLLSLSCFMKLETFPLDSQNCPIKVESYGYTTEDLIFVWDKKKPIDFVSDKVPQYEMTDKKLADCTTEYTTGSYSCLVAYLHVKRDRGYYITQTFVPSILIVILSWASFWIDKEATPARVSVGLLTVLSITTQSASIFAKRLKVSYIKAVDVWMATCLIFVFSAYMEYALVNVLARKYYKTSNKNERMKSLKEALFSIHDYMTADEERIAKANGRKTDRTLIKQRMMEAVEENGALPGTKNKKKEGGTDIKRANLGSIVDKCARFFFPCGFVLFNIIFWTYYTMNWSS